METKKEITMFLSLFFAFLLIQVMWHSSSANNTSLKSSNETIGYNEAVVTVEWNYTYGAPRISNVFIYPKF